jgi:hypothetical protein
LGHHSQTHHSQTHHNQTSSQPDFITTRLHHNQISSQPDFITVKLSAVPSILTRQNIEPRVDDFYCFFTIFHHRMDGSKEKRGHKPINEPELFF